LDRSAKISDIDLCEVSLLLKKLIYLEF